MLNLVFPGINCSSAYGANKLPTIFRRMNDAKDEIDKVYLLYVVVLISRDCNCVGSEERLMIRNVGSTLHNRFFREEFNRTVDDMP